MKIMECVNCLWCSNFNKGSVADLIKMSKSGAKPARQPTIDPTKKETNDDKNESCEFCSA